jgi:hypothetical protein
VSIAGSAILTKLNLQALAQRLGVEGIVRAILSPVVVPVALVDGSIQATTGQALDTPFTAGETTAPLINTRLANTGALTNGQYNMTVMVAATENNRFRLRRRNAADSADIWAQEFINGSNLPPVIFVLRVVLAVNEFLVVENAAAGAAGQIYQASIWVQGPF